MLSKLLIVLAILAVIRSSGQEPEDPTKALCNKIALDLRSQCENFASVLKSLADFKPFYSTYTKFDKCMHLIEPDEVLQKAESVCIQAGLHFASLSTFSKLIEKFARGDKVCTIDYSGRIYELHKRVFMQDTKSGTPQKALIRALAAATISRCQSTLADRLLDVERRTKLDETKQSEAIKFLHVILLPLSTNESVLAKLPLDGLQYVPIMEEEMDVEELKKRSSGHGYEFKIAGHIRALLDVSRLSCDALNIYQNNLLGSLGLLVSLSYLPLTDFKPNTSASDQERIKRWTLASIVCQSVRTVMKMNTLTVKGKNLTQVSIMHSQKADLTAEARTSNTFESFALDEQKLDAPRPDHYLRSAKIDLAWEPSALQQVVNQRKFELLQGPGFKLSRAIYDYMDVSQKANKRSSIAFELLGLSPPTKLGTDDDDDDEEDEEE